MPDDDSPDDLCDLCMTSGVTVDRTTYCGLTIGIECGCEDDCDGTCYDESCEECGKAIEEEE